MTSGIYEIFFYRRWQGKTMREIYLFDTSTRDTDEAAIAPERALNCELVASELAKVGFAVDGEADCGQWVETEGAAERNAIEMIWPNGLASGCKAQINLCHVTLSVPIQEFHPDRDEAIEQVLRSACVALHGFGLIGYDPGQDRELRPDNIDEISDDINGETAVRRPWWLAWLPSRT